MVKDVTAHLDNKNSFEKYPFYTVKPPTLVAVKNGVFTWFSDISFLNTRFIVWYFWPEMALLAVIEPELI